MNTYVVLPQKQFYGNHCVEIACAEFCVHNGTGTGTVLFMNSRILQCMNKHVWYPNAHRRVTERTSHGELSSIDIWHGLSCEYSQDGSVGYRVHSQPSYFSSTVWYCMTVPLPACCCTERYYRTGTMNSSNTRSTALLLAMNGTGSTVATEYSTVPTGRNFYSTIRSCAVCCSAGAGVLVVPTTTIVLT